MANFKPEHAVLPLWADKDDTQRAQTLRAMFDALAVYASATASDLPSVEIIAGNDGYETAQKSIMDLYDTYLGQANAALIKILGQVKAYDSAEAQDIARSIAFIRANPNAMNMNCEHGHVTGSALVIDPQTSRVLLHRHKKLGIWLQFGGHADFETDITQVAMREAQEESGLTDLRLVSLYNDVSIPVDVEVQKIGQKGNKPAHLHYDMRYLLATDSPDQISAAEGESQDFWWLSIEEAQTMPLDKITAPVQRLISKAESYMKTLPLKPEC